MALPNELEQNLIIQLRSSCKDVLKDEEAESTDMFLVRWLRAKDWNLKKAELLLRENKKWRIAHKVHTILDGGLDTFFKGNYPVHLGLTDKRNRPAVILPLGKWNFKTAVRSGLSSRFNTFLIQCMEAIMSGIKNQDAMRKPCAMPISQFTAIVDFQGFHHAHLLDIKVLRRMYEILKMLKENYPETLAQCLCLNCPALLEKALQSFVMTALPRQTVLQKVHWIGSRNAGIGMKHSNKKSGLHKFLPEEEAKRCVELLELIYFPS